MRKPWEIEALKSYMYIQNVRYNDKYVLKLNIDDKIYHYKVLKLILQPVVENSIIHGFQNREEQGIIEIKAVKYEHCIRVDVKDNGKGLTMDTIKELMSDVRDFKKLKFSGIGLANVHQRLKLKYGDKYGLEINSIYREGTTISIILPLVPNETID